MQHLSFIGDVSVRLKCMERNQSRHKVPRERSKYVCYFEITKS